ncbi:MAG: efflux RND transporter permease subunit, partial [Alphaproteobacteria bacterium]
MDLIRYSIERPIAVVAAVTLILIFGGLALSTIPIQLAPNIAQPAIHIATAWRGAAPEEVEREIVNKQEEVLRGLPGLQTLVSTSQEGSGRLRLGFPVNHNMDRALLLVASRLDRVNDYPDEAKAPSLRAEEPRGNRVAWIYMWPAEGNSRPIDDYGDFANDVVRERLERVPGVRNVSVRGGRERELRITFDPAKMARYGLTVRDVLDRLRRAQVATTAGDVTEGKRRYVVRTDWRLSNPDNVRRVVLRSSRDDVTGRVARVTVDDIATVAFAYRARDARVRMNGRQIINFGVRSEVTANVVRTMKDIRVAIAELQQGPIRDQNLVLRQMYDESIYIDSAIDLVLQNIWIGGAGAVLILLLFLRSGRATLVVALAIPTSIVACFVALAMLGGSINVLSLAGIAFAVGMVVDAAIIVLENIYRLRQRGEPPARAALQGTRQVWGAILVSSLTTVLVFIPLLLMDLEVGKLFRDIGIAITVAVSLSLLVSITVIPALANRLLIAEVKPPGTGAIDRLAAGFVAGIVRFTQSVVGNRMRAVTVVAGVTLAAGLAAWGLMPPLEYLPEGDKNLVIGRAAPPPGYNLETSTALALQFEENLLPRLASRAGAAPGPDDPPTAHYFTFIARRDQIITVSRGAQPSRAKELVPIILDATSGFPGVNATAYQPSIFRNVGGSRTIELTVSGAEFDGIFAVVRRAQALVGTILPRRDGTQMSTRPRLEFGAPEIRIKPDAVRLADNRISARDLSLSIDAYNDGVRVDEILVDGRFMDLVLVGQEGAATKTQAIANLPIFTGSGSVLPVSSLATVSMTAGPTRIRHEDSVRAVVIRIRPPRDMVLETALDLLRAGVLAKLEAEGLPDGVALRLGGVADALSAAAAEMGFDLLLAFAIVFLVMAVLFESFIYPLIIVLSVPIAAAGGVAGLTILNAFVFQPLDML